MGKKYEKYTLPDGPIALANSGGGSKGAYSIGHLQYLIEIKKKRNFPVIYGTSTGSLISALFGYWVVTGNARHFYDLVNIYSNVETDDIITPHSKIAHALGGDVGSLVAALLSGENSLYSTAPIESIMDKFMTPKVWATLIGAGHRPKSKAIEIGFAISCLETGEGRMVSTRNTGDPQILRRALLASANEPVFTPPVDVFDDGQLWVDGGLTDYSPIEFLFQSDLEPRVEAIIALSLDTPGPSEKPVENKVGGVLFRTLELLIDGVYDADMQSAYLLNFMAKVRETVTTAQWQEIKKVLPLSLQRKLKDFVRSVPILSVYPKRPFKGEGLVFDRKQMRSWMRQGFREAASWYK